VSFGGRVLQPLGMHKSASRDLHGFTGTELSDASAERVFLGPLSAAAAPRVDIVAAYAGSDAVALDAFVAAGARGVVARGRRRGERRRCGGRRRCDGTAATAWWWRCRPGYPVGTSGPATGRAAHWWTPGAVVVPRLRPSQARVLLMATLAAGASVGDVFEKWG